MATKQAKHVHSFSTNFFGVVGYIGSSFVWLLVFACTWLLLPNDGPVPGISNIAGLQSSSSVSADTASLSPILWLLMAALLMVIFWIFAYVASRVLSRVVRRLIGIVTKKAAADTLFKVKFAIHALGLLLLTVLLMVGPILPWMKMSITLLGLIAGIIGVAAIALQRLLARRHKVSFAHIL